MQPPRRERGRKSTDPNFHILIAGLLSSTEDKDNLAKIAETIPPIIESYDSKKLYAEVNEAKKKVDSDKGRKKAEEMISNRLGVGKHEEDEKGTFLLFCSSQSPNISTLVSYSPPPIEELHGKPLFDQLFRQLESPYAISMLRRMDHADLQEFSHLMKQGMDTSGRENAGVLNTIQSFLAARGLKVIYHRDENPQPIDIDMEAVEIAERAVEDASLSKSSLYAHIRAHIY